jgi:hypothetical protein
MQMAVEPRDVAAVLEEVAVVSLVALVPLRQLTLYLATREVIAVAVRLTELLAVEVVQHLLVASLLLGQATTFHSSSAVRHCLKQVVAEAFQAVRVEAVLVELVEQRLALAVRQRQTLLAVAVAVGLVRLVVLVVQELFMFVSECCKVEKYAF